ncbi:hypothetical protein [Paenibacillus sp. LPE1-1-1.1]|uniref:hypothetical protein n=1 Tax=Paenibacillus sp. LPE1-1-1.1 TaxID=3135230 RepID=UPI003428FAAD
MYIFLFTAAAAVLAAKLTGIALSITTNATKTDINMDVFLKLCRIVIITPIILAFPI